MGNRFMRMTKKDPKEISGSKSKRMGSRSQRKLLVEEEMLQRQVLSMALHQSQRFEGSMSRRLNGGNTASRRRTLSDPFSNGKQLPEFLDSLKCKKIVLIHGEGFGAWCWYKTIALLEEAGLHPTALDLKGSGINTTDSNHVTTLAEFSEPLIDYLQNLEGDEKVMLVGHGVGGACISYAMEQYPEKVAKAIFLCATMVSDGQRPFDVLAEELGPAEHFMKESKFLIHGNGKDKPPTGFMFERQLMRGLYFHQSPAKDVALAMVSMRPIPLGPVMEKIALSAEKYGTCRRFYIQTLDDRALSPDAQEKLVRENPPEGVFKIKGSDHSPFFSKPQSLHKILVEIAQTS
ncbi:hypothetical protein SAY87_014095 [Trapa incisa]|uniref:AB hydrolase-1 domain-containing protein n=1 Tax=Trapa incisa TaxID=236973 RepID=A0AAN7GZL8_9MYRT|nr:hypothetical protein SAY87_014095 [Trapa incisa]